MLSAHILIVITMMEKKVVKDRQVEIINCFVSCTHA
jgi:hypothetical protein